MSSSHSRQFHFGRIQRRGEVHCFRDQYQSIALEELYNFTFGSRTIGRSVRPQIDGDVGHLAEEFVAERVAGSSWTHKTFDRAAQRLSIDVQFIEI